MPQPTESQAPWESSPRLPGRPGVAIPLGATPAQLMGALRAQENGGLDHSVLHMLIKTLSA